MSTVRVIYHEDKTGKELSFSLFPYRRTIKNVSPVILSGWTVDKNFPRIVRVKANKYTQYVFVALSLEM